MGIVTDREVMTTRPADANGDVLIRIDGAVVLRLTNGHPVRPRS